MEGNGNGLEGDGSNGQALPNCLSGLVDDGSTECHRYYLSRRTVLEMLRDRGYAVPISEFNLSLQEFRAIHGQSLDFDRLRISVSHKTDPSKRVLVVFYGPGTVKVSGIRLIAGLITNKESLTGLILILQNHITNQALKALDLFSFKVEIFQITDLLVNITKHVLKPKHQVLTEEEKQRLLQKYSIEEKQLPRLLKKDAIARYYGFERGKVVKVTYGGEIIESHVTYRCVW
ncbi:DNA-directed RNA polymerase V subunit 5A-like [Durio zibethinus]|uniref:DNA-directed RNA polymerase V subunit 5A-like n=1 Tax=Durio zibethinus TaxID=66656 RepID=A0A6P6AP60_DURZI|nr:DNA-directed RNA polymerase V subunit 5A-like [Durio zibethinus]